MRIGILFFFLFSIAAAETVTSHEALPSHACTAIQSDVDLNDTTSGLSCSAETDEEGSIPEFVEFNCSDFKSVPCANISFQLKDYHSNLFRPPNLA
ncbi:MAG: hypothetical protein A4S09_11470 [Proteobacteria bacterium SG_bin7]|nr:MAG: hypothetical protein A4S09_11470 [Proteobacteria bacterium SG_bin7]